ncbi:MAG: C_GCAxxG_C_C family protein [Bacteroidales bacterium]|nr:C_GCAxxG_C_C family protein [Bacteroidales bacterium]
MNIIEQIAITDFRGGLNCSQAVLTAFADDLQLDKNLALSIACGFGGGMGRLQETCGAVTGSFMVMGVHNCRKYTDNRERKEKTYAMVQEFSRRFKSIHGTLDCIDLLHADLKTNEGKQYIKDNNLYEVVCEKCITDAIHILGDVITV